MYFHLILDSLHHSSFVHGFLIYLKNNMKHLNVADELPNVKFSKVNFEEKVYFKIFLSPFIYIFLRSIYSVVSFPHAPKRVLGRGDIQ